MCVCVREEREREREREREGHITAHRSAASLQTHTSIITVSLTRLCSPLRLELMLKLRTSLTVFTFILKYYERGVTFPTIACGVRPITMHFVSHCRINFVVPCINLMMKC